MPIDGFDYKAFAKNLSDQVGPALPPDLADADKQYIINIVHNFCYMAGEALANDTTVTLNADQACIITQFIGEWSFHKAIDIIRSNIDPQFRDGILQKIAFTIFEIAKTAIMKNMPQPDMIAVVEFQVKKAYTEALEELKNRGILTEAQVAEALNHSNIDEMAQQAAEQEAQQQAQQQAQASAGNPQSTAVAANNDYANSISDVKILKLATFAIVLRYLPPDKQAGLLERFDENDAAILRDYAAMDDLEHKLDPNVVAKGLKEIRNSLPKSKKINPARVNQKLYNIVKNSDISKISNIIGKERKAIKDYVANASSGNKNSRITPRIADIICNHLEEKLTR